MIGDWVAQWPALVAALAVVYLPGILIGLGLRLRGIALWALAPVASVVVLAGLAIVYGFAGITWSPVAAGIGCLIAALLAAGVGLLLGRGQPSAEPRRRGLLAAGLGVGVVLGALRLGFYIGDPAAISQTNDAVFHLNALRFILESGSASSFDVSAVIGGRSFYPAAWHALASLTALLSGAEIPVAVTMVSLVIAVGVWTTGIAWFTRVVSGSPLAAALAAALAPSLLVFPLLMLQWGVLYPYALAIALVPAVVTAVIVAPSWIAGHGPVRAGVRGAMLVVLAAVAGTGALAMSQPVSLLVWAVLALSWFAWWAAARLRRSSGRVRVALIAGMLVAALAFVGLWVALTRSTSGSHWPPFRSKIVAALDVVLNSHLMLPAAVGVSILMVVGLVVAVRTPRLRWLATSWVLLSALYALCAAVGNPWVRKWILGGWYADPYRLAALAPLTVVPLAGLGLAAVVVWLVRVRPTLPRAAVEYASLAVVAVVGVVTLIVAPVVQMPKVVEGEWDEQTRYAANTDSFLSPDERALLERLDASVPADARVIGNPSAGTGFAYMFSGRDVYPRTWAPPRTEEWDLLAQRLRDAAADPAVCDALARYGEPDYVLDFGPGEQSPGRYLMPGMTDFADRDGFEFVDREGEASLWRITACS